MSLPTKSSLLVLSEVGKANDSKQDNKTVNAKPIAKEDEENFIADPEARLSVFVSKND
jgi:hypothetical protein